MERFHEADLIEALLQAAQLEDGVAGAMTTVELKQATGHSDKWIRDRLRPLLDNGRVQRTQKPFTKIDGTTQMITAYLFIGEQI